jgi:hypothetical protein
MLLQACVYEGGHEVWGWRVCRGCVALVAFKFWLESLKMLSCLLIQYHKPMQTAAIVKWIRKKMR